MPATYCLHVLGRAGIGPGLRLHICLCFSGTDVDNLGLLVSVRLLIRRVGHAVRSPLGQPLADGSFAFREQRFARRRQAGLMVRCLRPSGRNRPGPEADGSLSSCSLTYTWFSRISWKCTRPVYRAWRAGHAQDHAAGGFMPKPLREGEQAFAFWELWVLTYVCIPLRQHQCQAEANSRTCGEAKPHSCLCRERESKPENPENTRKFNNRLTVSRL